MDRQNPDYMDGADGYPFDGFIAHGFKRHYR